MDFKDGVTYLIHNFAATIAAIIAIAGVIAKIKPIGRGLKRFFFAELYAANEKQDVRIDRIEMNLLRQIVCDPDLPPGDRLRAGREYIDRGGNGEIEAIYNALLMEFQGGNPKNRRGKGKPAGKAVSKLSLKENL